MSRWTAGEERCSEKACDFVEDCLNNGLTFDRLIEILKWAWVYVHDDRAYKARLAVRTEIRP